MQLVPNPGSDEANTMGCLCATLDNNHGLWPPIPEGTYGDTYEGGWYITVGCPVHYPGWPNEEVTDAGATTTDR